MLPVIRDIAHALRYAHEHRIVHRDVKPSNILIDRKTGIAKLSDFGIVKAPWVGLTREGLIVGTPGYMSPEQIHGEHLDGRSDIFSLGVVWYEALAGKHPFVRDTVQNTLMATLSGACPSISEMNPRIPGRFAALVHACLEVDRTRRLDSAAALVDCLERGGRRPAPVGGRLTRAAASAASDGAAGVKTIAGSIRARSGPIMRHVAKLARAHARTARRAFQGFLRNAPRRMRNVAPRGANAHAKAAAYAAIASVGAAIALLIITQGGAPDQPVSLRVASWRLDPRIERVERLLASNRLDSARTLIDKMRDDGARGRGEYLLARWYVRDGKEDSARALMEHLSNSPSGEVLLQRNVEILLADMEELFRDGALSEETAAFIAFRLEAANHPIIQARLRDTHYWMRWNAAAVRQAASLPVDTVNLYMLDLKHGGSLRTRLRAAAKLGEIGDTRAVPALEEARAKGFRDPLVAAAASSALESGFGQ
jgi:hypothetical protein